MTVIGEEAKDTTNTSNEGMEVKEETSVKDAGATKTEEKSNMFDNVKEPTDIDTTSEESEKVEKLSRIPGYTGGKNDSSVKINGETFNKDDLAISPEEKSDFIESMLTGARYKQRYSLFGGRISVVVRNRTAEETNAMYAYIRHILAKNGDEEAQIRIAEGDMAYVPLVAQIDEINGTKFPEMKEPLTYVESEGKEIPPGWYNDFLAWKKKPEGLTSALISIVQLFEYKYWTMTREASNKNFWNADTSIEE